LKLVKQFMLHDWMTDIPTDFRENWLCGIRPEGERCLVYSQNGRTLSRNKTGNFIHKHFNSNLPSGNNKSQQQGKTSVLDCIWINDLNIYYVIDVIIWNDMKIYESDSSTRLWWVKTKIENNQDINIITKLNQYKFIPIITHDITVDNLYYVYKGGNLLREYEGIKMDGLLFYHKYGRYEPNVSCPLILTWKDKNITPWY